MSTQILGAIESNALPLSWPAQPGVWGEAEKLQQEHYDEIGPVYHEHYVMPPVVNTAGASFTNPCLRASIWMACVCSMLCVGAVKQRSSY